MWQPREERVSLLDDSFDASIFKELPRLFQTLLTAELDAEPMSALDKLGEFHAQSWMKFVLLALFGCSAVLLLLNLLIARFAETVRHCGWHDA